VPGFQHTSGGISVRFVPESDVPRDPKGMRLRLDEVPTEDTVIADKLFGAKPRQTGVARRGGWREQGAARKGLAELRREPECGVTTRARLPVGVPTTPFGPRLQAMVSLCSGDYRMSKREVERILTVVTTLRLQKRNVIDDMTAACQAHLRGEPAESQVFGFLPRPRMYFGRRNIGIEPLNVDFAPFEAPRARKPAAGEGRMIAGEGAERSPAG